MTQYLQYYQSLPRVCICALVHVLVCRARFSEHPGLRPQLCSLCPPFATPFATRPMEYGSRENAGLCMCVCGHARSSVFDISTDPDVPDVRLNRDFPSTNSYRRGTDGRGRIMTQVK